MAKATRAQGDSYTEHELSDPTPPLQVTITRPMLGVVPPENVPAKEVTSSATADGGDSIPSSGSELTGDDKQSPSLQQPAPTTENPSNQTGKEISDADSTDGNGHETEQPQSGRKTPATAAKKAAPAKKATTSKARATMMGAEDDFSEFE